jgi:hypothetical protein
MHDVKFWVRIVGAATAALTLFSITAIAQGTGASINGIVRDSTGAVVNNATVTATNTATNQSVTTQTQSGGEYTVLNLQPST